MNFLESELNWISNSAALAATRVRLDPFVQRSSIAKRRLACARGDDLERLALGLGVGQDRFPSLGRQASSDDRPSPALRVDGQFGQIEA